MELTATDIKKDIILNAAAGCFAAKGYIATDEYEIMDKADVPEKVFHLIFKNKYELLKELCLSKAYAFEKELAKVKDLPANAREKLRMAVHNHAKLITDNVIQADVFFNEWKHLEGDDLVEFRRFRTDYQDEFKQIIIEGEKEKIFKETDRQFAVLTILSSINWISEWYLPDGKMKPTEIADKIIDFLLKGLEV